MDSWFIGSWFIGSYQRKNKVKSAITWYQKCFQTLLLSLLLTLFYQVLFLRKAAILTLGNRLK